MNKNMINNCSGHRIFRDHSKKGFSSGTKLYIYIKKSKVAKFWGGLSKTQRFNRRTCCIRTKVAAEGETRLWARVLNFCEAEAKIF